MKGCIIEAHLEGQGWQSTLFTILLILTWELRYPQKRGVNRKREGVLEAVLPGKGANDLPWGRKGLPGEPEVWGNYTDYYKMNFIQDHCERFFLQRVPSTDFFKYFITLQCHDT